MTDNISEVTVERPLENGEQELDNSPGSQLRRARESAGLSREELSRRLCINGNKLELLERDEYNRLPSAIYVRGYIRNACKELGIDAAPVLQAYAGYCTAEEASREIVAHVSRSIVVQERKRSLKGFALLPLLIVGGVFWWLNGRNVAPPAISAQGPSYEEMAVAAAGAESQGSGTTAEQSPAAGAELEHSTETVIGGDEAPLVASAVEAESAPASLPEPATADISESEPVGEEPVAETPSPAVEPEGEIAETTAPTAEAPAAAAAGELQLSFAEEAWIEVRDASNAVLLAKLQAAGSEVVLTGQPPFRLMLGNASGTQVRYQGKLIESDPIGNRRTRRLTVGE